MSQNLPTVIYHNLNELVEKNELEVALSAASENLNKGHISSIINAFFINTKICVNSVPYIQVSGLSAILRTGSSGAERPLIYRGIQGIVSASEIVKIDGKDHISGPTLTSLIQTRIHFQNGKTKQYLNVALNLYNRIINLAAVRDLKDVFLEEIQNNRPHLKKERIEKFNITRCEFSGTIINDPSIVEFAHIESVAVNPLKALDINNGVIILKTIHAKLTQSKIHTYEEMYHFCQNNNYSTDWA